MAGSLIKYTGERTDPGANVIRILSVAASSTAVIPDPESLILYSKSAKTSSTLSTGEAPKPTSAAS